MQMFVALTITAVSAMYCKQVSIWLYKMIAKQPKIDDTQYSIIHAASNVFRIK